MENGKRPHCLLPEEIYEVILKVIPRVTDLPAIGMGISVVLLEIHFSLKTGQVVTVSGMTKLRMRVVGWISRELHGCRERCSIHSLYFTDSNRAGGN